jgi:hypothetical protein
MLIPISAALSIVIHADESREEHVAAATFVVRSALSP